MNLSLSQNKKLEKLMQGKGTLECWGRRQIIMLNRMVKVGLKVRFQGRETIVEAS